MSPRRARRLAAGWVVVVVVASVVDPAAIASLWSPSGPATGVGSIGDSQRALDGFALAHGLAYGVFAWLVAAGIDDVGRRRLHTALVAVVMATAVGLGVELVQAPLAARTASADDAFVNAISAVVGAGLRAIVRARN
ncbi:VanZ family protein [Halobellus sp. GM3]|uniref:VanZ family protein n=1 Tax=Halobellus sp. GM3 TaxID=3458410 RepID=UPI00403E0944